MNKNRKKPFAKRLMTCAIAFSMALAGGTACGEQETNGNISVIVRSSGADYWDYCKQGAEDAGKELRYNITYTAPQTEKEDNVQVELIRKAIADKVDALVISPLDTDSVAKALSEVQQAGIPIIIINNEANGSFDPSGRKICIATNATSGGAIAARKALEITGDSGYVEILSYAADDTVVDGRKLGFEQALDGRFADDAEKKAEEDSDSVMKVINVDYCNADADTAYKKTLEAIDNYPDKLKIVYATNETTSLGACKAVKERQRENDISVISFDSSAAQIEYLVANVLDGIIVQNPYNMGYLGVRYAHQVIEGNEIPENIDTGVTYVDINNYQNDGVQLVIDPVGFIEKHSEEGYDIKSEEEK